jgi:hypothetical protein
LAEDDLGFDGARAHLETMDIHQLQYLSALNLAKYFTRREGLQRHPADATGAHPPARASLGVPIVEGRFVG